MRRILVLRGGALGDLIVTLPALALLRQRWPEAHITLVGNPTAGRLALRRGLISELLSQHEGRWTPLHEPGPLPASLSEWLAAFDAVLNFWPDPDGALQRHFPTRVGQVFLEAPALPKPGSGPAAAHFQAVLAPLGLQPGPLFYPLSPATPPSRERSSIIIHPGSGSPRKNWPLANWLRLARGLPVRPVFILGEAEVARWDAQGVSTAGVPTLRDKTLEDLIAELAGCRLFLGHDSGISHLAAGCGARCVLLFGPTDPAIWAPPSPHVQVLQAGADFSTLSPESVLAAAQARLADQRSD
jgi:heptosyltransferase-3